MPFRSSYGLKPVSGVEYGGALSDLIRVPFADHMLGVDPTRFPPAAGWRERLHRECALPIEQRSVVLVMWLLDEQPIGFSTSDKIRYGEQANMHLHVTTPIGGIRVSAPNACGAASISISTN